MNRLSATVQSYYSTKLLRITQSFTNVCKGRLHDWMDFAAGFYTPVTEGLNQHLN